MVAFFMVISGVFKEFIIDLHVPIQMCLHFIVCTISISFPDRIYNFFVIT